MMKKRNREWIGLVLLTVAMTGARGSWAADPTPEEKERARTLLFDGRAKLEAGDAHEAVKSLQAAHAIMGVPTTGFDLARGLAAVGQLVEARAMAVSVAFFQPAPNEPEPFATARASAAKLIEELDARIPTLVVDAKGPNIDAMHVTLDGTPLATDALRLPRKVNPGEHLVTARAPGFRTEQQSIRVKEGEAHTVELYLVPQAKATDEADGVAKQRQTTEAQAAMAASDAGRKVPGWAWISGGTGLVALGVGAAFFVDYMNVRAKVAKDCPGNVCTPARYEATEALEGRWNRDLGLTVGLGAAGLVGVGAAVVGMMTAPGERPSDASARSRRIAGAPWMTADGAGAVFLGKF